MALLVAGLWLVLRGCRPILEPAVTVAWNHAERPAEARSARKWESAQPTLPLLRRRSQGDHVKQRDIQLDSGGIEASPSASRHYSDTFDDEAHQLTALAEVCFGPQAPGVGMQDDPLLALAIDLGVETLNLALQPRPDPAVPALADRTSHVKLVVEGLQTALR